MPVVRAQADIDAPADLVWQVLLDLDGYEAWNPFTPQARSTLAVGDPIDMKVVLWTGTRDQREFIRSADREQGLCWGAPVAGGLVQGERKQTVEALGDGRTRYVTEDAITGPLAPVVALLYGRSLQNGFDAVARGLKSHCESLHRGRSKRLKT